MPENSTSNNESDQSGSDSGMEEGGSLWRTIMRTTDVIIGMSIDNLAATSAKNVVVKRNEL